MDAIAALYGSSSSSSDDDDDDDVATSPPLAAAAGDPSGRKRKREDEAPAWTRAFAHVEGNWPSHVRVSVGDAELRALCGRVVARAQRQLGAATELVSTSVPASGGGEELAGEFHLSLSRPFALRYEQITPFVLELRAALKWRRRFVVSLASAAVLVNDERTRSFLALRVGAGDGAKDVAATLQCVDACMKRFALPLYYEDPIPHVSIASSLGASLPELLPPDRLDQLVADEAPWTAAVTTVHVAIGNKQFRIPLQ